MIRDLEEVLNTVYDHRIKEYLNEALRCYNMGAYRACVIMSVIAGIFDLHRKVKELAPSNPKIRALDTEIENLKANLNVYETTLIDKCATPEIDMLDLHEKKNLLMCMQIRNDCAHPSDFACTAEIARFVFTMIVDILASKPLLLGQQHINILLANIKDENFFPIKSNPEIENIVACNIKSLHPRAYLPLANKLVKVILDKSITDKNYKINAIAFLANMNSIIENQYSQIISNIISKSEYRSEYLLLLKFNPRIILNLDVNNIKRTLNTFKLVLNQQSIYKTLISEILLFNEMDQQQYREQIADILVNNAIDISRDQGEIILLILSNNYISLELKETIKNKFKNSVLSSMTREVPPYDLFHEIVLVCDSEEIYNQICNVISTHLSDYDYTIGNPAAYQFDFFSHNLIDKFSKNQLSKIIYSIAIGANGYSRDVRYIMNNISSRYIFKRYLELVIRNFEREDLEYMISYFSYNDFFIKLLYCIYTGENRFLSRLVELIKVEIGSSMQDSKKLSKIYNFCDIVIDILAEKEIDDYTELLQEIKETISNMKIAAKVSC